MPGQCNKPKDQVVIALPRSNAPAWECVEPDVITLERGNELEQITALNCEFSV